MDSPTYIRSLTCVCCTSSWVFSLALDQCKLSRNLLALNNGWYFVHGIGTGNRTLLIRLCGSIRTMHDFFLQTWLCVLNNQILWINLTNRRIESPGMHSYSRCVAAFWWWTSVVHFPVTSYAGTDSRLGIVWETKMADCGMVISCRKRDRKWSSKYRTPMASLLMSQGVCEHTLTHE